LNKNQQLHLRRIVATSVFLAISLILRTSASGYIPLFGAHGTRVGIHGVFTIMPAILFGPWYGAIASGLGDLLGHFINPTPGAAWLWQMTLIATFGGFIRGWAWRLLRGRSVKGTRIALIVMTVLFLGFGSFSMAQLRQEGITRSFYDSIENPTAVDTSEMNFTSRMIISRTQNTRYPYRTIADRIAETVYAPLGAGALGVLLLAVDLLMTKGLQKSEKYKVYWYSPPENEENRLLAPWNGSIMPLALTIILISLLINTGNSLVLWRVIAGWDGFPFMYIWLPRAVVSLLNSVLNVFIAAILIGVCYKQPQMKALVEQPLPQSFI